jgi:saccharopine dehydrogenase (NAD+, L-lysine-forming)
VKGTSKFPVHVQAIDHLPTLLPRESSEEYSALLFPHLKNFLISDHPTATWVDALTIFEKSMNDCMRSN